MPPSSSISSTTGFVQDPKLTDVCAQHVAALQEARRVTSEADTRRRTGDEHVAWLKFDESMIAAICSPMLKIIWLVLDSWHLLILARDRRHVLFVDGVEGAHAIRAALRVGATHGAHTAAAGKVLLAELSDSEIRRILPGRLVPSTPQSIVDREEFVAGLHEVRRRGYATNLAESEEDLHSVSVPVRDATGAARAAISVAAPSSRLPRRRIRQVAPECLRCARLLGVDLG